MLIAVGIGALFSIFFHCGVDEVKHNQVYYSSMNQPNSPSAMKAFDWLKEKQFYQVKLNITSFYKCSVDAERIRASSHEHKPSV